MAGRSIRTFTVLPHLPERLQALQKLAYNCWWCWNPEAISLFRRIDADLFETVEHSPVKLLSVLEPSRLERLLRDDGFLAHMDRVEQTFDNYMAATTWFHETLGEGIAPGAGVSAVRIAYFSAEFGLHESIPVYSGGLGVLAGDHIKSASDLDIPLIGVGLFYGQGYFRQRLDRGGWQHEEYLQVDVNQLPMEPAIRTSREPVEVQIDTRGGSIRAKVWRVKVGRCDLLLLDSNVEGNAPEDRELTSRLYGGATPVRIRPGVLLGPGGVPAPE